MTEDQRGWEKVHKPKLHTIIDKINSWNADYIVPVGRKSAKLFRTLDNLNGASKNRVFYRDYFDFYDVPLSNKKVAIVDDVARTCATLADYRDFFKKRDAIVRTFAVAGHHGMTNSGMTCDDPQAEIEEYLTEPGYKDFLLSESEFLNRKGIHHDLNHLTLELRIPGESKENKCIIKGIMKNFGYVYSVAPHESPLEKWSIIDPIFADSKILQLKSGIMKIRFHVNHGSIVCIPMVFPEVLVKEQCKLDELKTPFTLPCQFIRGHTKHSMDELCYWSLSLLLSAELGRQFIVFLKSQKGLPEKVTADLSKVNVGTTDFVRYFGKENSTKLKQSIEEFLQLDNYEVDETLLRHLSKVIVPRNADLLAGTYSGEALTKVIDFLREEYDRLIQCGADRGSHYSLSLNEMSKISGINQLFLMESIDVLCDIGTFVPVTKTNNFSIMRTWRTGENEDDQALKRTHVLIPFIINTMTDELNSIDKRVGALLLSKAIANFVYDYPSNPPLFGKLHCFIRIPDRYGTVPMIMHPYRTKRPLTIYEADSLGNRYTVEAEPPVKKNPHRRLERVWFKSRQNALHDIDNFLDNTQNVTRDEISNYFCFLAKLAQKTGSVEVLTALSVCRSSETFYWHVYENLKLWIEHFYQFLQDFEKTPDFTQVCKGNLRNSGATATAGLKKIEYWNNFDSILKDMKLETTELRFGTALKKILNNIERPSKEIPVLGRVKSLLSIQRALTGIALAKISPGKRSPDSMIRWADVEFQRNHFDFDIRAYIKENEVGSLKQLQSAFYLIWYAFDSLPKPKAESEVNRNKTAYLEIAQNRAVQICLKKGWTTSFFVHWDLTDSRKPNAAQSVRDRIASMYEKTDQGTNKFGGECITPEPGGNDCVLFVFSDPIAALTAACCSMQPLFVEGNLVKGGIAFGSFHLGDDYSSLMAAMGHAKDLCELKRDNYRNRTDILASTPFIEILEEYGLDKYFTRLQDCDIDTQVGSQKKKTEIFKFDWSRFYHENVSNV